MKLAIIFGGKSYEHEISIVSTIVLQKVLNHSLEFVFCDGDNDFYHIQASNMKSEYFTSGAYKKAKKLELLKGGFYHLGLFAKTPLPVDCALNLIHGGFGEEGTLSAMLEYSQMLFVGPRMQACVFSYHKAHTKLYAASAQVATLEYEIYQENTKPKLSFPLIIKPCRGGSSIGIFIAHNEQELEYYTAEAKEYDSEIIYEPYIENIKEYNLAGYFANHKMNFSIVEEPQKNKILDFEKKYLDFARDEKVQKADISEELEKSLQEAFTKIYTPLFQGAIIRCDFFVANNKVYLNEINPIPGSMANYLFDDFNAVLEQVYFALPKGHEIEVNYQYLHQIKSAKG